jgi:hypothetical protein
LLLIAADEEVEGKSARYLIAEMFVLARDYLGDAYYVLRALLPREDVVTRFPYVQDVLPLIPEVVAWMHRSACHRGISVALGLVLGHLPNLDLNLVTRAFAETWPGDAAVECLAESVAPYVEMVLSLVDLNIHQGSQVASGDEAPTGNQATDFTPRDYIWAADERELTTFETTTYVMRHTERLPSLPFVGEEYLEIGRGLM